MPKLPKHQSLVMVKSQGHVSHSLNPFQGVIVDYVREDDRGYLEGY